MSESLPRVPPREPPTHCPKHPFYHRDCWLCRALYRKYKIWESQHRKELLSSKTDEEDDKGDDSLTPWWVKEKVSPEEVRRRMEMSRSLRRKEE